MTATPPKLILLDSAGPTQATLVDSLQIAFDITRARDLAEARRLLLDHPDALLLGPGGPLLKRSEGASTTPAADSTGRNGADASIPLATADVKDRGWAALEHVAEGLAMVNSDGTLIWSNRRFAVYDQDVQQRFIEHCQQAISVFNQSAESHMPLDERHSFESAFSSGPSYFEVVISPASTFDDPDPVVQSVVGILWENTASRNFQNKIDAIDSAGAELMHIEASQYSDLNVAERLKLLESKIVRYVRELLAFDNFEVRLIDRRSNRLDLVIAIGITPLKIGEVIYAEEEGNGISGYVAATGQGYVCNDTAADPRYREGLDDARSSLTVPLRLNDRIIGVFNVESNSPNAFNENDRLFAEIFGRYIAMAMNILDLLVVERYTTNEQVSENMAGELNQPLVKLTEQAERLEKLAGDNEELRKLIRRITRTAKGVRKRLVECATGPRTILETEQELHRTEADPLMQNRRVLIADDEPAIREGLMRLLTNRGCEVTACENGVETLSALETAAAKSRPYDVVISDIKMPDRNGYEIFRAARALDDNTQVILMTGFGYDPHHSIVRASQDGLHSFLFKPFKASQLIESLTKAFEAVDQHQPAR